MVRPNLFASFSLSINPLQYHRERYLITTQECQSNARLSHRLCMHSDHSDIVHRIKEWRVRDKLLLPSFSTGDEVEQQRVATDTGELKFERDSRKYIHIYIRWFYGRWRDSRHAVGGNLKVEATSGHTGAITQYLLSRGTIYRSA